MAWQRLKYGTQVLAFIATTGTLVWFSTRRTIRTIDTIELIQAGQERAYATQYEQGSNSVTVVTNTVDVWGANDPSGLSWIKGSTNGAFVTNLYKAVSGTTNVVVTTTNLSGYSFHIPAMVFVLTNRIPTSDRRIWGGYSNYTASGFGTSNANGEYRFSERIYSNILVDVYTNEYDYELRVLDKNGDGTASLLGEGGTRSSILIDAGGTELYKTRRFCPPQDGPWYLAPFPWTLQATAAVVSSNIMQNFLRDAWIDDIVVTDQAIDSIVTRIHIGNVSYLLHGDDFYQAYGLVYGNNIAGIITPGSHYLDMSQSVATNDFEFIGKTVLPVMTGTGLWARLDLPYSGSTYVKFPDENSDGIITNRVVTTNAWAQRYKALYELQATRPRPADVLWRAYNDASNTYVWRGINDTNWALAVAACKAATPTLTKVHDGPMAVTYGEIKSGKFYAWAKARKSQMEFGEMWTGLSHRVHFYSHADRYTFWDTGTNAALFNAQSNAVGDQVMVRYATNGTSFTSVYTSPPLGQITFPAFFCDQPTASNNLKPSLGFWVTNEDASVIWDFEYCTNAIP